MITPKAKYFLIACGFCFLIILTLNRTNEGIIYHKMVQNLTEVSVWKYERRDG